MLKLEVRTKLSEQEAMDHIQHFFGGVLGLRQTDRAEGCITFVGGGGFVTSIVCPENGGGSRIDLETQEWETQVRKFAEEVT
ncbi:MAG: hypothetical protein HYY05_05595 [Chloroflexi bacterium]|nr:hypothetical protein [Chloroflexota bacterium]